MKLPDLPDLAYAAALIRHEGGLDSGSDFDTELFERCEFDSPRAPGSRFLECAFRQVSINDGSLQRSGLREVWARDLRLTGTSLAESSWREVTYSGRRLRVFRCSAPSSATLCSAAASLTRSTSGRPGSRA